MEKNIQLNSHLRSTFMHPALTFATMREAYKMNVPRSWLGALSFRGTPTTTQLKFLDSYHAFSFNCKFTSHVIIFYPKVHWNNNTDEVRENESLEQLKQTYDASECCWAPPINPYLSVCLSLVKPLISESDPKELSSSMWLLLIVLILLVSTDWRPFSILAMVARKLTG